MNAITRVFLLASWNMLKIMFQSLRRITYLCFRGISTLLDACHAKGEVMNRHKNPSEQKAFIID